MSTKEARTRATRRWRARTDQKLIQAYLHVDTIAALDRLVAERSATGRAAVLAELIEQATREAQEPPQAVDSPSEGNALAAPSLPSAVGETSPQRLEREPDTRCESRTSAGGRCRNQTAVIVKVRVGGQLGEFGACKLHARQAWRFVPHKSVL